MSPSCQRIRTVPTLPARATDAHKGHFGRILVLGGSVGMVGAPSLVGLAALRSGAGLVTIAVPASVQPAASTLCPCATTIPLPETANGQIDPRRARQTLAARGLLGAGDANALPPPDVLVVGPGVGLASATFGRDLWKLIDAFRTTRVSAVIDADALNLASRATKQKPDGWDCGAHFRTVITPHPGELARIHGVTTRAIQADREGFAIRTAQQMSRTITGRGNRSRQRAGGSCDDVRCDEVDCTAVVVLKGAGTVVTDGKRVYVNRTGNPGMATGGSGDVLAGVIAGLIGQGLSQFDAAVAGVYLHGLAGDLAARRTGPVSLMATDIIDALPDAIRKKSIRSKRDRPGR